MKYMKNQKKHIFFIFVNSSNLLIVLAFSKEKKGFFTDFLYFSYKKRKDWGRPDSWVNFVPSTPSPRDLCPHPPPAGPPHWGISLPPSCWGRTEIPMSPPVCLSSLLHLFHTHPTGPIYFFLQIKLHKP